MEDIMASTVFKDFVIAEANSRRSMSNSKSGEFLVCRPQKGSDGSISLNLNLPDSVKKQMLEAIKHGQLIRIFSPSH